MFLSSERRLRIATPRLSHRQAMPATTKSDHAPVCGSIQFTSTQMTAAATEINTSSRRNSVRARGAGCSGGKGEGVPSPSSAPWQSGQRVGMPCTEALQLLQYFMAIPPGWSRS